MGIAIFIFFVLLTITAVVCPFFDLLLVSEILLGLTLFLILISTVISFAKGGLVPGLVTLCISVVLPVVIGLVLGYFVCWNPIYWISILTSASVVVTNLFLKLL